MTTSPATPSTPQLSNQGQALTSDRAASIGWYFIESYYDFYNKSIESIYKLYHSNGVASHASFPSKDNASRILHKASGIEAIKKRFQNDAALKEGNNRIVVTSADIQVCLQNKILIVVFGEWSKNNSPFWQFTQTFLLCPGKNENTFDLANDNLRFVDYEEYKKPAVTTEEVVVETKDVSKEKLAPVETKGDTIRVVKPQESKPAVAISNGESKQEKDKVEDAKKEQKEIKKADTNISKAPEQKLKPQSEIISETTTATKAENKVEHKVEQKTEQKAEQKTELKPESVPESKPEQKPEQRSEAKSEQTAEQKQESITSEPPHESKTESETEQKQEPTNEESSHSSNSRPISWAALAAQQPPPSAKPSVLSPAKTSATLAVKKTPPMAHTQQSQSPVLPQQPQPTSNGKYKKEDWFPIYIRGVKDIDEDKLKSHLTKKFGEIKFFRVFVNIALCDFVEGEAQKKALEAKETEVEGYVIQLEVRESKTHTGNKASVKNPKDKGNNNTNNEKRGRNDKKQNGKKNRSSSRNLD
mmetsp:Transcript_6318/g.7905  ORF Transcript_6318/g.7905 Transcript_6318/m.7905 type:complete len:530 (-) Transcript_6318:110-1699(-)